MKNYRMIIQYEGTRYSGWQKQKNSDTTIQGKLEAVLGQMIDGSVEVQGCGRTDAGVHAEAQTAHFRIDTVKTPEQIQDYLNEYLPEDIRICQLKEAGPRFHSRLNALSKIYTYRIWNSKVADVFLRRTTWHYPGTLDLEAIRRGADHMIGTHDFRAFCANKRYKKSTVRTIHGIEIKRQGEELDFVFHGDGFLYHMVRIMMGTLIEAGEGKRDPDQIPELFTEGKREDAGFLAPAEGLTLTRIYYD